MKSKMMGSMVLLKEVLIPERDCFQNKCFCFKFLFAALEEPSISANTEESKTITKSI